MLSTLFLYDFFVLHTPVFVLMEILRQVTASKKHNTRFLAFFPPPYFPYLATWRIALFTGLSTRQVNRLLAKMPYLRGVIYVQYAKTVRKTRQVMSSKKPYLACCTP